MKNLPWGIIAGICAMVVFFATVGTVAAFIVFNGIAGQTGDSIGLFDVWFIALLFFVSIFFALALIGSIVMYVIREKDKKRNKEVAE